MFSLVDDDSDHNITPTVCLQNEDGIEDEIKIIHICSLLQSMYECNFILNISMPYSRCWYSKRDHRCLVSS